MGLLTSEQAALVFLPQIHASSSEPSNGALHGRRIGMRKHEKKTRRRPAPRISSSYYGNVDWSIGHTPAFSSPKSHSATPPK